MTDAVSNNDTWHLVDDVPVRGDLVVHTCTADTVPDLAGCAGCRERDQLHLQPISKRARDAQIVRAEFERGPTYHGFGVMTSRYEPGVWLASCSWCGAVVIARGNDIADQRPVHTGWHQRISTGGGLFGMGLR